MTIRAAPDSRQRGKARVVLQMRRLRPMPPPTSVAHLRQAAEKVLATPPPGSSPKASPGAAASRQGCWFAGGLLLDRTGRIGSNHMAGEARSGSAGAGKSQAGGLRAKGCGGQARHSRPVAAKATDIGTRVTWVEYWNQETSPLYVNERHRRVHYDLVTRDVLRHLPAANVRVVDYGCGDTPTAARLAAACGQLYLCDAAPRVRERLRARYAGQPNITVVTPQQFAELQAHSIAMIVVNSVVQYLSKPQFLALLTQAQDKLMPGGSLLLADIVPRHVGFLRDTLELIKFAAGNGFLLPVLVGLGRSYFSPYRRIRQSFGFLQFEEAEILRMLEAHGFKARRQPRNIGHNTARMTFLGIAAADAPT